MGRILQALATWIALIALWVRTGRPSAREESERPAPERPVVPVLGVSYPQLRHLVVTTVFLVLFVGLVVWFALTTRQVLILLLISILLAVAFRPTVDRISLITLPVLRRRIPRAVAILLIYLLLALIAVGIGFLVVPPLVVEVQKLIAALPDYLRQLDEALSGLEQFGVPELAVLESQMFNQLLGSVSQAFDLLVFAINLVTGLLSIFVVLVFAFFLIFDAELIYGHFVSLLPPSRGENVRAMTATMGRKIEGWLKGSLLLALILGAVTTGAMWLLDMPYPLLLGLAAGLFELLPLIGPYLGAAPAGAIALFTQPLWKFIAVVLYFFVIQQIENNILAPHIFGRHAQLPPLLVILALLLGGTLYGVIGALVAVPVAAILQVLWTDLIVPEIRQRQ